MCQLAAIIHLYSMEPTLILSYDTACQTNYYSLGNFIQLDPNNYEFQRKEIQTVDIHSVAEEEKYVEATQFADFIDKLDVKKHGVAKKGLTSRHVSLLIIG